jgi:tetratricopeptide (TPR) repeat protein
MGIKEQIKSVLREAEIYRTQGLFNEAMVKFKYASELIEKNVKPENGRHLVDGITKKIELLKQTISKYNDPEKPPEMPVEIQNLIKEKFSFSTDKESAALDGAIALTKFGQFERAIKEFKELLKMESFRLVAAKNILRCYFASSSSAEGAVSQYKEWLTLGLFTPGQLEKIRFFLENLLKEKGIESKLPAAKEEKAVIKEEVAVKKAPDKAMPATKPLIEIPESGKEEEEFLDVSSVGIILETGGKMSPEIILDVSFQSGNMVSLIVPVREKLSIENMKAGLKLNNVQFYSPIAILNGSGVVSAFTRIGSGPKMGNYSLDLKMFTN